MKRIWLSVLLLGFSASEARPAAPPHHKLLVVSVDGLDWRYMKEADTNGVHIPNIRKLLREGWHADGVVGVFPSVTWPSHTSLITGVRPDQHGILGNRRPKSAGGDYYWTPDLLKARTLWQAAKEQGFTTASVTWPVTTGADITYDLPEYFQRRNGGYMDLASIASKATAGLVDEISKAFPSFGVQWMDDRTRSQAVIYMLQHKQPDLMLVHLVDLDSEEHDQGPFTKNAYAMLERTDELIGDILQVLPKDYDFALVSDHGFERMDQDAQLKVLLKKNNISGDVQSMGGVAVTSDPAVAAFLRKAATDPANKIGREIPHAELVKYAPQLASAIAAFEPVENTAFGNASDGPYFTTPPEKGDHGLWPTHPGYRSVFIVRGPHVKPGSGPTIEMITIAGRLAELAGIRFPQ